MTEDNGIAANLAAVKGRIAEAARAAGRAPETVELVAISKTKPAEAILAAIAAGQRVFGENRVQEAEEKWPVLRAAHPEVSLHLVGPLQRNKLRRAVALFDVIQSVDREKLAAALAEEMAASGRRLGCFVQVNTGEEPQKAGVLPTEVDAFVAACRNRFGLDVRGLMCIPPVDEEPSLHFALLAEMARRNGLAQLSMGMSDDFEVAVRFGATHVRVGTALFGGRPPLDPQAG
ncbi:YggS family pyridoxal phosphate-dependent enzyme [Shumkonia mesophila]|uniref:YggS family pyridoxal phosphate-dependent enzyme n=1 Tax=Shumkonia mesophila TaxID=2838854 RepID=UPI002934FB53|nr:YggS family pyridoxal phosphate-dependent enzyme [Shumkonia mesophila]